MKLIAKAPCVMLMIAAVTAAHAQTAGPRTRDEVRQELAEALRNGTIPHGESGLPLRELFPNSYPKAPVAVTRTRAEVLAELEAARLSGDLIADGESALKLKELYPSRYPQPVAVAGKTRAEVKAQLAEALRTGDVLAAGESGLTLKEMHPGLYPRASTPVYAGATAPAAGQVTR
jgi:hypothetical protein